MAERILIGGQAVIEGVMMRAPNSWAIAVRKPSGEVVVRKDPLAPRSRRFSPLGWPVIRGASSLIQTLILGISALNYSANIAAQEINTPGQEGDSPPAAPAAEKGLSPWALGATVVISLAAGLFLFLYLPLQVTQLLRRPFALVEQNNLVFNLVDGAIRIAIFLLYVVGISSLRDIRRVFQYHGAEHKVVHAYEAGEELTVDNTRKYPTMHPRCGTSFLLVVMLVSILAFAFISKTWPFWAKLGSRLLLIPVIAGVSYEFIRFSSARRKSTLWCYLLKPGLWLQRLTTREPDEEQIQVAIVALKDALAVNEGVR